MIGVAEIVIVSLIVISLIGVLIAMIYYGVQANTAVMIVQSKLIAALESTLIAFASLGTVITSAFTNFVNAVIPAIGSVVGNVYNSFASVVEILGEQFAKMVSAAAGALLALLNQSASILSKAYLAVNVANSSLTKVILKLASVTNDSLFYIFQNFYFIVSNSYLIVIQVVVAAIATYMGQIVSFVETVFKDVVGGITVAIDAIKTGIKDVETFFNGLYNQFVSAVITPLTNLASSIPAAFNKAINCVTCIFKNAIPGFLCSIVVQICNFFNQIPFTNLDCNSICSGITNCFGNHGPCT